jgi:phage terminase small subunit
VRSVSPKQQRFIDEDLIDLNATAAAKRAGYQCPNKQGLRLLVNVGIAEAIKEAQQARSERVEITQDDVLRGLKAEAMRPQ